MAIATDRPQAMVNMEELTRAVSLSSEANHVNGQLSELNNMAHPNRIVVTVDGREFDMTPDVAVAAVSSHLEWLFGELSKIGIALELDPLPPSTDTIRIV
jgi:hypothetical protein